MKDYFAELIEELHAGLMRKMREGGHWKRVVTPTALDIEHNQPTPQQQGGSPANEAKGEG